MSSSPTGKTHLAGQISAINSVGDLELVLAHRITLIFWRLNRIIGFERDAIEPSESYLRQLAALRSGPAGANAQLDRRALPTGPIEHVQRYAAHLHRIFLKDLHELEALQSRRRGDATPLARVEIN